MLNYTILGLLNVLITNVSRETFVS